uniref:Uncharacterized protein n=1 Tax=Moumouvirus sp. 'Monve' TaxID=1128131 RepID=H2EDD7_9VIRU|nr:hypothetical protein mv_L205 [Moumouvirus Monve]
MSYMNIPQEWYDTYGSEMNNETLVEIYIDNSKIEEPIKEIDSSEPIIDFDKFIAKTQKFFQYFLSPKYFISKNQEIDTQDKDTSILNLV